MADREAKVLARRNRLQYLVLSFFFLLLALGSKRVTGSIHEITNHYIGDLFIVGSLYFFILVVFIRLSPISTAVIVFAFSVLIEIAQAYVFPFLVGIPEWFRFWFGTTFDPFDIVVYFAGVALAVLADLQFIRRKSRKDPGP